MKLKTRSLLAVLAICLVASSAATAAPPDRRFAVTYAHVVESGAGRYLVVRVKGPAKKVRIRVSMIRQRRVVRVASRWVGTNHRIRVPGLTIPARVTTVRIRILGHVG